MSNEFERQVIDVTYPEGPLYDPAPDGAMSDLRDGDAECMAYVRTDIKTLAYIRDPQQTPCLSDLELDLGVKPSDNLTEQERRDLLTPIRYPRATTGNDDDLQTLLDKAFGVGTLFVYNNSPDGPAIDPAIILDQNFIMQAQNGTNYYAGNTLAYAGRVGGYLLVNGAIFTQSPDIFGAGNIWAGNAKAVAGYFEALKQTPIVYPIPTDPNSWPMIFFVGGPATFNPDGSIATIEQGFIHADQKGRMENIILKFKPMFDWCGVVVTFT